MGSLVSLFENGVSDLAAIFDSLASVAKMLPYVVGGLAIAVAAGILLYSTAENPRSIVVETLPTVS